MKAIVSWSSGKDSCLALHRAIKLGYEPVCLMNFVSEEYNRCCFHGIPTEVVKAQAESLNIPLFQKKVPATMEGYEVRFKETVKELMAKYSAEFIICGDIYLLEQQNWVERVCKEIGITPVEPLWQENAESLVEEFIDTGFKTMVVSAKADIFNDEFLGKTMDKNLIQYIKERKSCVCGENGEFHSFVYDGPLFKNKINITKSEKILRDGFWKHWFLDIQEFNLN